MKMLRQIACLILILSAAGGGCRDSGSQIPPVDRLLNDMAELIQAGDTNTAIALLEPAVEDPLYRAGKSAVLGQCLRLMLDSGLLENAQALFLRTTASDPSAVEPCIGMIESYLRRTDDFKLLVEWTSQTVNAPFSPVCMQQVFLNHFTAINIAGREDLIAAALSLCIEKLGADSLQVFSHVLNSLFSGQNIDRADLYAAELERFSGRQPALGVLVADARLKILAARKQWEKASELFGTYVQHAPDQAIQNTLSALVRAAGEDNRREWMESICEAVLDVRPPGEHSVLSAAGIWLRSACEANQPDSIPPRFARLLEKELPAEQLVRIAFDPYYAVLNSQNNTLLLAMVELLEKLRTKVVLDQALAVTLQLLLDGNFILGRTDAALAIIENGIPGKDERWHRMAASKLKAHEALAENKAADAIKHFRTFMKIIAERDDEEVDPSNGLLVKKEWCLGKNAARIGDLHASLGEKKEAAMAYAEAVDYYVKASALYDQNSPEYQAVTKELVSVNEKNR